jgi:hypothetical protein
MSPGVRVGTGQCRRYMALVITQSMTKGAVRPPGHEVALFH